VSSSIEESLESALIRGDSARGRLIRRPRALCNSCTIFNNQIELILIKKRRFRRIFKEKH
jgi:hypothetical protein